jgi:hypothetical protein
MERIWRNVFRHGNKERRISLEIGRLSPPKSA